MRNIRCLVVIMVLGLICGGPKALAQADSHKFEVGLHFASLQQRAFSRTDRGIGGRFSFSPTARLGFEADMSFFPKSLGDPVAFSKHRTEALFGLKAGQRFGRFGLFAKARPGFVRFAKAPRGTACIALLVYPLPLECSISMGATNFALDFGGVIETYPSPHTMVRVDLGDTMIRFTGPAFTGVGHFMDDFNVHNFQLNIGFAFRF